MYIDFYLGLCSVLKEVLQDLLIILSTKIVQNVQLG